MQKKFRKQRGLGNYVGFVYGTFIREERPGGAYVLLQVVYNGHKREHALKFQAWSSPCGLVMRLTDQLRDEGAIGCYM